MTDAVLSLLLQQKTEIDDASIDRCTHVLFDPTKYNLYIKQQGVLEAPELCRCDFVQPVIMQALQPSLLYYVHFPAPVKVKLGLETVPLSTQRATRCERPVNYTGNSASRSSLWACQNFLHQNFQTTLISKDFKSSMTAP